jgi:hypothetical protein
MAGPLRRANDHEDIEDNSQASQSLFIILVVAAQFFIGIYISSVVSIP